MTKSYTKEYCEYFIQNYLRYIENKRLLQIGDRGDVVPLPVHLYAVMLAHVNSSVNPIVYGLTNKQFRLDYLTYGWLLAILKFDGFNRKIIQV